MADGKSGNGLVKGVTVCGVVIPMILIAPIVLLMSFSTILVAMVQAQYGTQYDVLIQYDDLMGRMGEEHRRGRLAWLQSATA